MLLPHHLTPAQQKLVYAQENRAKLDAEPVEISLGDVTLPLEHLDRNHLPNRWKHLREIVRQSSTREDWENVIRVLEGFENAGVRVKSEWRELVVRNLNASGNQHLVLKALQRAKATGLRLSEYGVLVQVCKGVHDRASLADWEEEETRKAARFAKQIVELMDEEEHCGGQARGEMVSERDWRSRPFVIALPTELAARLALSEEGGAGAGSVEEVAKLAKRLVAALQQSQFTVRFSSSLRSIDSSVANYTIHRPTSKPQPT